MTRTIQGASVVDIKEQKISKDQSVDQLNEDLPVESTTNFNPEDNTNDSKKLVVSDTSETSSKDNNLGEEGLLNDGESDVDKEDEEELVEAKAQENTETTSQDQVETTTETEGETQGVRRGFEFKISEPVTEVSQETLETIYEGHLKWVEALLNPNRKVFEGRANLSGADLSGFNLDGMNFSGASFKETNLRGASLIGTNFTGADLTGADLTGAMCSKTKFRRAILSKACLIGVDLESSDLTGAVQLGTVFKEKENKEESSKDILVETDDSEGKQNLSEDNTLSTQEELT